MFDTPEFLRVDPDRKFPDSEHPHRTPRRRIPPRAAGFRRLTSGPMEARGLKRDFRFRRDPAPGRGPTLVCSGAASRVLAEGEPLPAPSPPVCTVSLAGAP